MNAPEQPPVLELRKHYAVDLGPRGKLLPIRKNKVTASLIAKCTEQIVDLPTSKGVAKVRTWVAEGAVASLLAPYIDSKKVRNG